MACRTVTTSWEDDTSVRQSTINGGKKALKITALTEISPLVELTVYVYEFPPFLKRKLFPSDLEYQCQPDALYSVDFHRIYLL
jgi:hypothetical protein